MTIQTIIDTYYQGWAKRNRTQARFVMADDMRHSSPEANFYGADNFLNQCSR